jgi:hypothetical protein
MKLVRCTYRILAIFLGGVLPLAAAEQNIRCKSVPAPVAGAFRAAYPKAVIKSCAKEIDKDKVRYEFLTEEGKTHRDVVYSEEGKLIVAEETIPFETVPDAVKQALKKKHPKGTVTLSEKLTGEGGVKYEFRVKSGGKRLELVFDDQGKEVEP